VVNENCRAAVDPGPVTPGPIHERRAPSRSEMTRDRPRCSPVTPSPTVRRHRPEAGDDSASTSTERTGRTTMPTVPCRHPSTLSTSDASPFSRRTSTVTPASDIQPRKESAGGPGQSISPHDPHHRDPPRAASSIIRPRNRRSRKPEHDSCRPDTPHQQAPSRNIFC
jgi:hypothetical protein